MVATISPPQAREAALSEFLRQAPVQPVRHEHSCEDDIDLQWQLPDRVIQLEIYPGLMTGQWLSWRKAQPLEPLTRLQPINLTRGKTWQSLFRALQC